MAQPAGDFEKQDRAARLMLVLQILAGSPHGITAQEIGNRTDRNKRTALRDLRALEDIGVPLISEPNDTYKLMPGYVLPTIAFTQQETMAILLATRLAVQHLDYYNEFLAMAAEQAGGIAAEGRGQGVRRGVRQPAGVQAGG